MPDDRNAQFRLLTNFAIGSFCALVLLSLILSIFRPGSVTVSNTRCFNVDILEARSLHHDHDPVPRNHPPLTIGHICFDLQQQLVYWRVEQSFSLHFKLADFTLHGPLPPPKPHAARHERRIELAPSVLALGLLHDERNEQILVGSRVAEQSLIVQIVKHPTLYYLSLVGVDEGQVREVGRHVLDQPISPHLIRQ